MKKNSFLILFLIIFISAIYTQTLSLWGGKNYKVFLGYLNVNKFNTESIWNDFGDYGSKYSSTSIWNSFGDYGSKFSSYSPWNSFASYSPKIFDESGNYYGFFTISKVNSQKTKIKWLVWILDNYEFVLKNKDQTYKKLFE